ARFEATSGRETRVCVADPCGGRGGTSCNCVPFPGCPAERIRMRDDALGVIIPSLGRPATLHETLLSVLRQSRQPGQIIVSVPDDSHLAPESRQLAITFVRSETGLCRQRNRAIEALQPGIERVTFLDDDVELHAEYFEQMARLFAAHSEVVLADGKVLLDARDMSRAEAEAIIAAAGTP